MLGTLEVSLLPTAMSVVKDFFAEEVLSMRSHVQRELMEMKLDCLRRSALVIVQQAFSV